MSYVLNTPEDQRAMLARIGVKSLEELFQQVPATVRLQRSLDVPPALSEIELTKLGKKLAVKDAFGQIESVKSVNDLYAPVAGEIIARNEALEKDPTIVSGDPYGKGWMIKIKMASKGDYDKLLTPDAYEKQIASQAH